MISVLQSKNGDPLGGLIHVSLHPNFKRDDLLRLLHVHGTPYHYLVVPLVIATPKVHLLLPLVPMKET